MGLKTGEDSVEENKLSTRVIEEDKSTTDGPTTTNSPAPKKIVTSVGLSGKSPRRKKKMGVRQTRRTENNNFLFTLLDGEENPSEDIHITDFITSHQSAFEQLFLQQENMEIWSEFMNRSGEEQDRFLAEVEEGMIQVAKKASLQQDKNGNGVKMDVAVKEEEEKSEKSMDKRAEHPAHTPQECFQRISSRLQTMLRRRHLPKGSLELHEGELVSWFTDDPSSVFISRLPSSFDRLLLHAVCQYLDLNSESFDCEGGRQTRVENTHEFFRPPTVLLSAYLDNLR